MCRYCVNDLSLLNIEIIHDHLPTNLPLPEPPLVPLSKPASSKSCRRRPTPRWMEKLPSNRVSKHSASRIPKPLIPHIIEPSAQTPSIQKQLAPPRDPKVVASTPTPLPSSSSSPSTTTTTLLPPDSNTTTANTTSSSSPSSTNTTTVVVAELRTPISSSSIRKTYAKAAALTRTDAQRRRLRIRKLSSRSSPYVAKDLSALFSAVGRGG